MIFTASLALIGTDDSDDPISEALHNHYKTQCLKKVDLRNYELHELFLVKIVSSHKKTTVTNLRKLKNSSEYSNMVMYRRFMAVIKLIILN